MECVRTLYRRKATLLWIAFFGIIAATLFSIAQPRTYQSQASVQIQGINENFLNLRDIYPTAAPSADNAVYVQTQADMLQQDALIQQVVRKLQLEERPEYRSGTSLWDRLRPTADSASSQVPAVQNAVEQVKKNLQIVASRGSSIIRIVSRARDPQLAADLANTVAQTFIEQSIEARQRSAQQTFASLSRDLEELRKKTLKAEAELGRYGHGPAGMSSTGSAHRSAAGAFRSDWMKPYTAVQREADGDRQFYESLSRRADEADVASTVRQSNIRLVSPAQPATHPYRPNVPLNLALGIFGGLALGDRICDAAGADELQLALPRRRGCVPDTAGTRGDSQSRGAEIWRAWFPGRAQWKITRRTGLTGTTVFGRIGIFSRHARVHPFCRP